MQSRPFHLFFTKPLLYSWPTMQQSIQQVQQPAQRIELSSSFGASSPMLEALRDHNLFVNPFKRFLQGQSYLQSTYSASPPPMYSGRIEVQPSFSPSYSPSFSPMATYGPPPAPAAPSYEQPTAPVASSYGPPPTQSAPSFAPTGPPATVYGPPPNYQTNSFQPPNYQAPVAFNPIPPQQPQPSYGPPPPPPNTVYGLPPSQFPPGK